MLSCHTSSHSPAVCLGAGGTQKKILGEPTMMPNWDRDAEVPPPFPPTPMSVARMLNLPLLIKIERSCWLLYLRLRAAGHDLRIHIRSWEQPDALSCDLSDRAPRAQAGRALLRRSELEIFECPLHLEGGSIHTDGEG